MSTIVFRGKTYNSVFEMPDDIREAYQIEKRKHAGQGTPNKSLTDFIDMPDEIREMYERALKNVEEHPASSRPLNELPTTEDIYRQSAPSHMKNLPSDESVFRPSPPLSPPQHPAIEEDDGPRRLIISLLVAGLLAGIIFLAFQFG